MQKNGRSGTDAIGLLISREFFRCTEVAETFYDLHISQECCLCMQLQIATHI